MLFGGLFAGITVGAFITGAGFLSGLLPPGTPHRLPNPCRTINVARLVPGNVQPISGGGRVIGQCSARTPSTSATGYSAVEIEVTEQPTEMQSRGCTALAALGTVRHVGGLGDAACAVTEDGRLRITTVLVRRAGLRVYLRYSSEAKDAAAVERDALDTARRVTSAL
ncbi:hypothetical protein ACQPZP_18040 [Spirillospora sp. CA-142024]|uniref:hypothetical protein n=1 Tax=Spirillospora sp. CA-142024 TaxID=3240036 RepID=UPI003D93FCE6